MWSYENKSKSVLYKAVQIVQNGFIAAPPVSGGGVQNELTWCPEWVEQAEQLIRPMGPIGPIRPIKRVVQYCPECENHEKNVFQNKKVICICRFNVIYLYEYTDCSIDFYVQFMRQAS